MGCGRNFIHNSKNLRLAPNPRRFSSFPCIQEAHGMEHRNKELGDNQTIDSGSRSLRDIPKSQATASAVSMKK